jgi:transposase-like protein
MMKFSNLLDSSKCYEMLRQHRWPDGIRCPHCNADAIILRGEHHRHAGRNRYQCNDCKRSFDDLSLSVFSGHHQPLKVWMHGLYLMSLNLSNLQIANELGLNKNDAQRMTEQLRMNVCLKKPEVKLTGEIECDEVYVVAGHKGKPDQVKKKPEKEGGIV